MAARAETIKFADFVERIPVSDWVTFWDAAHNRKQGRLSLVHFITGNEQGKGYTAFYNVNRAVRANADGTEFVTNNGSDHWDQTTGLIPLQTGATMDGLADAVRRFQNGEGFRDFTNAAATPNSGSGSSAATPGASSPSPATKAEPLPVDPTTVDAVAAMLNTVRNGSVPVHNTGRQFLSWMWEQTPESIREQRTADIVRGVLDGAESAAKRGLIRRLMDSLNGTFTVSDQNGNPVDLWNALYSVLPDSERTASTEQVATIVGNTYRFDPNAPLFRNWATDLDNRSRMIARVVGKDRSGGDPAPHFVEQAASDLADEALTGIAEGLNKAQDAYEKHIAARLAAATPPPPVAAPLAAIPFSDLSETVRTMIPEDVWNGVLSPDQQRQWLISRSISPVGGIYVTAEESRKIEAEKSAAAPDPAPAADPAPDAAPPAAAPVPETETKSPNKSRR